MVQPWGKGVNGEIFYNVSLKDYDVYKIMF